MRRAGISENRLTKNVAISVESVPGNRQRAQPRVNLLGTAYQEKQPTTATADNNNINTYSLYFVDGE